MKTVKKIEGIIIKQTIPSIQNVIAGRMSL